MDMKTVKNSHQYDYIYHIHNPLKYTKSMCLCVQLDQWKHIILLLIFCHLHTFTIIDANVKHGTGLLCLVC